MLLRWASSRWKCSHRWSNNKSSSRCSW